MRIKFEKVNYSYTTPLEKVEAIKNIDLEIKDENEIIGIVGHTGSGKSTLMQHLNALLIPQSGQITIGEYTLPSKKIKLNSIRKQVGLVFQFPEYQIFEETILKDVMFGPKNFKESKEKALELSKKALLSVGIKEEYFDESPFRISGGEMRSVAIAGILACNPKVLILDEPTRGLDPKKKHDIMELFKEIHNNEGKGIIMISHDMDVISEYCSRIIVMKEGNIAFDGNKHDLFIHPDFHTFHLDYPKSIQIIRELNSKLNLNLEYQYSYQDLLEYLKKI
jgi:energy-coupling factor transport system ATP-binding protein